MSDPLLALHQEPRLLEAYEVAHRLKCSQEHVRRLVREGKLAVVYIGKRAWRVSPQDLQAFLDKQRTLNGNGNGNGHRSPDSAEA
jgi:excisionase family DNA binding protein